MKKTTIMNRIAELDKEIAQVQKDDIGYDTLINLFNKSKQQANFMILYLTKCKEEGLSFDEAQFDLEGVVMGVEE